MPFITQFTFDKREINILPHENFNDVNVFTIIIGKNSVGKSRLLGSIIDYTLKKESSSSKKIIAISNTSYNKFPSYKDNTSNYIKLLSVPHNGPIGYLFRQEQEDRNFEEFKKYIITNEVNKKIKPNTYLDVRRLIPKLLLKIKENSNFTYQNLAKVLIFLNLDNSLIIRLVVRKSIFFKIQKTENIDILKKLEEINSLEIPLEDLSSLDPVIIDLILMGLIDIFRIYLYDKKSKQKINYRELSSGQLAILTMGLALISELENDSIICIDEPEVNLHPQWQEEIINLIESISENYKNCQFLIATHSPQIVSNLTYSNSYVLDLNSNELKHTEELKNRSADFQLTEVFSSPGNNNEYLLRKLLIILSKINSNQVLNEDENHTKELVKKLYFEDKFHEKDKVKTLVELLLDLED